MQDGDDVHTEVEKIEVEKAPKKPRKPMSEESLKRLAVARQKANKVRKNKLHTVSLSKKTIDEK